MKLLKHLHKTPQILICVRLISTAAKSKYTPNINPTAHIGLMRTG